MVIHFLNLSIVINEEQFAIFMLNNRFSETCAFLTYILSPILRTIPYVLKCIFSIIVIRWSV
jgi:hypothetical protein